jgi:hypothetical protein
VDADGLKLLVRIRQLCHRLSLLRRALGACEGRILNGAPATALSLDTVPSPGGGMGLQPTDRGGNVSVQ